MAWSAGCSSCISSNHEMNNLLQSFTSSEVSSELSSEHLQTLCLPQWPPCCWLAQVSPPQDAVTVGFHQLLAFLLYFLLVLSYLLNTLHRRLTVQGLQGLLAFKARSSSLMCKACPGSWMATSTPSLLPFHRWPLPLLYQQISRFENMHCVFNMFENMQRLKHGAQGKCFIEMSTWYIL